MIVAGDCAVERTLQGASVCSCAIPVRAAVQLALLAAYFSVQGALTYLCLMSHDALDAFRSSHVYPRVAQPLLDRQQQAKHTNRGARTHPYTLDILWNQSKQVGGATQATNGR